MTIYYHISSIYYLSILFFVTYPSYQQLSASPAVAVPSFGVYHAVNDGGSLPITTGDDNGLVGFGTGLVWYMGFS